MGQQKFCGLVFRCIDIWDILQKISKMKKPKKPLGYILTFYSKYSLH